MWFRASEWSRLHPNVPGSGDVTLPVRQNQWVVFGINAC